jgi:hypothetical protein
MVGAKTRIARFRCSEEQIRAGLESMALDDLPLQFEYHDPSL